jgi:hypothetical protein
MAEQYDPSILQRYADILYSQAKSIIAWTALKYGVILGALGWLVVSLGSPLVRVGIDISAANGTKLQAQPILCQRQIELNTRRADAAASAGGS